MVHAHIVATVSRLLTGGALLLGLSGCASLITAGASHTCVARNDGNVFCWGNPAASTTEPEEQTSGLLGSGKTAFAPVPAPTLVAGLQGASQVSASDYHTCALKALDGSVWCWGSNFAGQLGNGSRVSTAAPVRVVGLPQRARSVAAGNFHACAALEDGSVYCWGGNFSGQLGNQTISGSSSSPVLVAGVTAAFQITAGQEHTCATTGTNPDAAASRAAFCWGSNTSGQLGDGTTQNRPTPVPVSDLAGVRSMSAGSEHTCALIEPLGSPDSFPQVVKCWGKNSRGQLGDGSTINRSTPTQVQALPLAAVFDVSAGDNHTCAALAYEPQGESGVGTLLRCWGANSDGQLGDGTTNDSPTPVAVPGMDGTGSGVSFVAAGSRHTCAIYRSQPVAPLTSSLGVRCWGAGGGLLGDGSSSASLTPVVVTGEGGSGAFAADGQTVRLLTPDTHAVGASVTVSASASSGLPVTLASNTPEVCSISGSTVTTLAPGQCELVATQAGGTRQGDSVSFASATATVAFTVAGQTITFERPLPLTRPGSSVELVATASSGLAVSFQSLTPATCSISGQTLQAVSQGVCLVSAGQAGAGNIPPAPSVAHALEITAGLAIGRTHSCALRSNGTVVCWGDNSRGQLGNGNTSNSSQPVAVQGLTSVVAIAATTDHTCALKSNRSLWCWGSNTNGQLGNGTTENALAPTAVGGHSFVAVSTGGAHTCALKPDASAWCWGSNEHGQVGLGDGASVLAPQQVAGLESALAITAGGNHSCAVTAQGISACWGFNDKGQLGTGGRSEAAAPVPALTPGLDVGSDANTVVSVLAGAEHTCALRRDGAVACWGLHAQGQVGVGPLVAAPFETTPRFLTLPAAGGLVGGEYDTCALGGSERARCWGRNSGGLLANGNTSIAYAPITSGFAIGLPVALGTQHSCQVGAGGMVNCTGDASFGQLGNGTLTSSLVPVAVLGEGGVGTLSLVVLNLTQSISFAPPFSRALSLPVDLSATASSGLTVAFSSGTPQVCEVAGSNVVLRRQGLCSITAQQPGNASYDPAQPVTQSFEVFPSIAAGRAHSCTILANGTVRCWGENTYGQLGNGTTRTSRVPVAVGGLTNAVALALGNDHGCALKADGSVACWGRNKSGQLGNGTTARALLPVTVPGVNETAALVAGANHTCALLADGGVRCWGLNVAARPGARGTGAQTQPAVVGGLQQVVALAAGAAHTCALEATGVVRCWGDPREGQLGTASEPIPQAPIVVQNLGVALELAAGAYHTCAVREDGTVACWGRNLAGQLGNGSTRRARRPVEVASLSDAVALVAGSSHTCALRQSGAVACWGSNKEGQIGAGSALPELKLPTIVTGMEASSLASGASHLCASSTSGLACWGRNLGGQLGNGTATNASVPVGVSGFFSEPD